MDARLATLHKQQAEAHDRHRARIDARIKELEAAQAVRKAKLTEARRLAKQSVEMASEALVS